MKYLTPLQYRASDDGISLTGITDLSLARYITRAESDIDAYVEFDPRNGGFEPHTVWIQEQFDERTLRTRSPNGPVPVRQILRYRIQVSNQTGTGAGFFANISQADASINVFDQYVEIVPLQSITYSLTPVLMQLGLRPPIVQMDVEIGFYLAAWKDTLLPAWTLPGMSGVAGTSYAATRGYWAQTYTQSLASQPNTLPPIPPVIYVNGAVQSSGYTIDYTEGIVTFNPVLSNNPVVQADYTYTIPDNVRDAAILQTTHYLQQRQLNTFNLGGLEMVRTGDQQIQRPRKIRGETGNDALCEAAQAKLQKYKEIAIA